MAQSVSDTGVLAAMPGSVKGETVFKRSRRAYDSCELMRAAANFNGA
jgi:hypothetical protein